ncbi:MAG: Superoxide dismutase [Cu-Zn] precursor [Chloroflexi bacterium]|nr:Superoxide dismutase [Cu-Zn] precursor [Chloroflexota bacterium]
MSARTRIAVVAIGAVLALAAPAAAAAEGNGGALHATAELRNLDDMVVGWARFTEDANGILHVNVHVRGLSEGLHGIHIHAKANCDSDLLPFDGATGHHALAGQTHGLVDPPSGAHAGDLPNLTVNGAKVGHLDATSDRATLSAGPRSVFDANGSALVIHAGWDDQVTNPTGNSGSRIACGIIVAD